MLNVFECLQLFKLQLFIMRDREIWPQKSATVAGFCPARLHAHYDVSPVQLQPPVARRGRKGEPTGGCSQLSGKSGGLQHVTICNHNVDMMRMNLYRILVYLLTDMSTQLTVLARSAAQRKRPTCNACCYPKCSGSSSFFPTKRDRK